MTDFSSRLRVRAYEYDSLGHVNNSVYLQYLQHATQEALGSRRVMVTRLKLSVG